MRNTIDRFLGKLHNEDIYLIKRQENGIMNHMWPEHYPEFENKSALDVMPYLFGGMAFRNGKEFFSNVLNICLNLPSRFHRWYGDQYSLKINVNNKFMSTLFKLDITFHNTN